MDPVLPREQLSHLLQRKVRDFYLLGYKLRVKYDRSASFVFLLWCLAMVLILWIVM